MILSVLLDINTLLLMLGCLAAAAVCITCYSVLSDLLNKALFLGSTVRMLGSLTGYLAVISVACCSFLTSFFIC